ncbi:hypothetical protein OAU92_00370 [Acidimicrobiia bacterium]|nr:hypothetical protein [Acidimicrobiia bacterium]
MKIKTFFNATSENGIYEENKHLVDELESIISDIDLRDIIKEYDLVTHGNRSLAELFKKRLFTLLDSDGDYIFNKTNTGTYSKTTIDENLDFKNRLTYTCRKNNIYLTFTTDNIGFMENKIFKNLLIIQKNKAAVPVILTIGEDVREIGAWDPVVITFSIMKQYLQQYELFINFPVILLGIYQED